MLLTYWNTVVVPVPVRARGRLAAGHDARARAAGPAGAGPVGALRGAPARARGRRRRWRSSTPSARGGCSSAFVDDLSNWYVRRSRRRFWDGDPAALATLHECLYVGDAADGAVHPVRHRAGLAGPVRLDRGPGARLGAPGRLAEGRRRAGRRRPGRARGPGPAARRARPGGPGRIGRADPPAARPRARRRARLGSGCPTTCAQQLAEELNVGRSRRSPTSAGATGPSARRPASSSTSAPKATSARSGAGSGSAPRQLPRPSRRRTRAPWWRRCAATATRPSTVEGERVEVSVDEVVVTETPRRAGRWRPRAGRPWPSTSS